MSDLKLISLFHQQEQSYSSHSQDRIRLVYIYDLHVINNLHISIPETYC